MRELGGIIASDFTSCFQKADIEALFLQPLVTTTTMPRHIYITVDPNGGGMSKMAVVAGYKDGDITVVSLGALYLCHSVSRGIPSCTFRESDGGDRRHCSDWAWVRAQTWC